MDLVGERLLHLADQCVIAARQCTGDFVHEITHATDAATDSGICGGIDDGDISALLALFAAGAMEWIAYRDPFVFEPPLASWDTDAGELAVLVDQVLRCAALGDDQGLAETIQEAPSQVAGEAVAVLADTCADGLPPDTLPSHYATILALIGDEARAQHHPGLGGTLRSLVSAHWRRSPEHVTAVLDGDLRDRATLRQAAGILAPVLAWRVTPGPPLAEDLPLRVAQFAAAGRHDEIGAELDTCAPTTASLRAAVTGLAALVAVLFRDWPPT